MKGSRRMVKWRNETIRCWSLLTVERWNVTYGWDWILNLLSKSSTNKFLIETFFDVHNPRRKTLYFIQLSQGQGNTWAWSPGFDSSPLWRRSVHFKFKRERMRANKPGRALFDHQGTRIYPRKGSFCQCCTQECESENRSGKILLLKKKHTTDFEQGIIPPRTWGSRQ